MSTRGRFTIQLRATLEWTLVATAVALAILGEGARPALAQVPSRPAAQTAAGGAASLPGFFDPRRRPERPDLSRVSQIRFLTETDYPPFNYAGPDGSPIGFNVDLARMICDELKITCTVQMRRFDTLVPALNENRGDAIIASLAVTPDSRKLLDFSDPYYREPARFVMRRAEALADVRPERVEGKKIAVVAGSSHEAYLKTLFTEAEARPYPTMAAAQEALKRGEADLLFGDGIALAFWLNGTDSGECCTFAGGPFYSDYFGEGVGIAVRRGNETLRRAFNWALFRLWERGQFTDLWLRYFPVNPF
jgi:polar amino acid transport system substrate-binding protein